jgi:TRAP-type C4-dicarboxylate transport system permease large subunit
MCSWATVHEADAGPKGVWPFMIAQLIVLFWMVFFPGLVMIPAKWFGG